MSFLRFLMLLSLVCWIGGLIFFAFVLAPTAFSVLPTTHLAGNVVGRALGKLHWIGVVSGVVYLMSSLLYSRLTDGSAHMFAARHVLLCAMLGLTLISQFGIIPRMDTLRASLGEVSAAPIDNPERVQFDALHVWSTRVEGAVLLLGIGSGLFDGEQLLASSSELLAKLSASWLGNNHFIIYPKNVALRLPNAQCVSTLSSTPRCTS